MSPTTENTRSNAKDCTTLACMTISFVVWVLLTSVLMPSQSVFGQQSSSQFGTGSSSASSRFSEAARFTEYERQLNAILKTRRDEEKIFVRDVVNQVRVGKIPTKLVSTSFDWVNKKRPGTKYPFIYFEKVLRLQAQQLKIENEVPAFDFSIYRKSVGQLDKGSRTTAGQQTEIRRSTFITPGEQRR
ncbi:MAG: hypothetical protein AAFN77_01560 [Planctomycetota bacterium]